MKNYKFGIDAHKQSLERLFEHGESNNAYQCFLVYCSLQFKERNLDEVVKRTEYSMTQIKEWSWKFDWDVRASLHDTHQFMAIEEKKMKKLQSDIDRWAERMRESKEESFTVARQMVGAAKHLLDTIPLMGEEQHEGFVETKDGRLVPTVKIIKMNAKVSDIPRLAETGVKIQRLAAELPTEIIRSNVPVISDNDLAGKTVEEIQALMEQNDKELKRLQAQEHFDSIQ